VATAYARELGDVRVSSTHLSDSEAQLKAIADRPDNGDLTAKLRMEMGETMNEHLAVFRTEEGMQIAQAKVRDLQERYKALPLRNKGRIYNTDLIFNLELGNMLTVAETIIASGLARKESRGAHFRLDMQERDDKEWLKHTVVSSTTDGPLMSYLPVTMTKWEPQARVY